MMYQKLVRDQIPQIIESTGKKCSTRQLDKQQYHEALLQKMQEEMLEVSQATSAEERIEELADVMECLHAFMDLHQISEASVTAIQKKKAEQRGGFKQRIWLEEVYDETD